MLRKFFLGLAMVCAASSPFDFGPMLWRNEKHEDAFWLIWTLVVYAFISVAYLKRYWDGWDGSPQEIEEL